MNELLERMGRGDTRALAQVITRVENRRPGSIDLLRTLYRWAGKARVVGITGAPGSGKSTIVDRLAAAYRSSGAEVGILAIDPSSPFTRGALLGDRVRMHRIESDPGIFIRSMATRGHLGGLAPTAIDVVTVLDAAGRDPVIVETVGVGQDEIDIVKLADVSVVVLVPGMGDDVQALKAGIMEIGDVFVINKCDLGGADELDRSVAAVLDMVPRSGPRPAIVRMTATKGEGTHDLRSAIDGSYAASRARPETAARRREAIRERLVGLLEESLTRRALEAFFTPESLEATLDALARREDDPYSVVDRIVGRTTFGRDG